MNANNDDFKKLFIKMISQYKLSSVVAERLLNNIINSLYCEISDSTTHRNNYVNLEGKEDEVQ